MREEGNGRGSLPRGSRRATRRFSIAKRARRSCRDDLHQAPSANFGYTDHGVLEGTFVEAPKMILERVTRRKTMMTVADHELERWLEFLLESTKR